MCVLIEAVMSVEIWEARGFRRVITTSRTQPLVLECERRDDGDAGYITREFVVKALGHPEVLEETLFKELLGNLLAREFGLVTPTPALIMQSEGFLSTLQGLLPSNVKPKEGYAVGCEFLPGLIPIGPDFRLPSPLLPAARRRADLRLRFADG